jgi:putative transposase
MGRCPRHPSLKRRLGPIRRIGENNGSTRSLLVDGRGIPVALVVSGAETPDVSLLPETVQTRILRRAQALSQTPQYLSGDQGDTGQTAWQASQQQGYAPALQQRGKTTERLPVPAARRRRWVVERGHGWLNRFRKLTIRYEKLKRSAEGLLQLACAIMCWRQVIFIYG